MNRLLSAALAAAFLTVAVPPVADAQSARQMRQEVEASMLVTGHVDIDRSGQVTAHVLDQQDKLPAYVVSLIERALPVMRFEPVLVDGAPVLARAKMSLRMVATPSGNGDMDLRIAGAHFGEDEIAGTSAESVRSIEMKPPRYPTTVLDMGGKGTVYLLVRVGRDGRVADVAAEQVNLTALGNAREMRVIRERLAKAAINGARDWTFAPPTQGEAVSSEYWVVRVPVEFYIGRDGAPGYGEWSAYHPGELTRPSWAAPTPPGFSPDTLVAGGVTPEVSRFKLLTPLEG